MLDWNFIAGLIATVAFDIIYFGAIIGTITVIILDNRNPVKTNGYCADVPSGGGTGVLISSAAAKGGCVSLARRVTTVVEEAMAGYLCLGILRFLDHQIPGMIATLLRELQKAISTSTAGVLYLRG